MLLGATWWNVFRVLILMTATAAAVGYLSKYYCLINGWGEGQVHAPVLLGHPAAVLLRGLADGAIPTSATSPADQGARVPGADRGVRVPGGPVDPGRQHGLVLRRQCDPAADLLARRGHRHRPGAAQSAGRSHGRPGPGIILAGHDQLGTCCRWHSSPCPSHCGPTTGRPGPGVLGLGIAGEVLPLLLLGPMFLLCWRARAWGAFSATGGAIVAWLAVNVPFMLANFEGWSRFYAFSRERGEDFGSIWLALTTAGRQVPPDQLNTIATGLLLLASVGIALLVWRARRHRAWHRSCSWSWPPSC